MPAIKKSKTEVAITKWTPPAIDAWDAGDDKDEIEPRQWLLGNTLCRGYISALIAPGGVGKTATAIAQALAFATTKEITGEHVFQRARVLYLSAEDSEEELRRRVRAAMLYHQIDYEEVRGHLFMRAIGGEGWRLAEAANGEVTPAELSERILAEIKAKKIDVVIIDPLIKAHGLDENSNSTMDFLATVLSVIASAGVALYFLHHARKGPADPGNADQARGASATVDAARLVYTMAPMTTDEAKKLGVDESERRALIRLDSAKVNIAAAAPDASWYRLVGVPLGNSTPMYPNGDHVQTIEVWTPPHLFEGVGTAVVSAILAEIDKGIEGGGLYSDHNRAKGREAWKVVTKHLPDTTEAQAREMLKRWIADGTLKTVTYKDEANRRPRQGLRSTAGEAAP